MIYEIPRGIIVLEGPDAAGKTTLAKTLVARHGGNIRHMRYHGAAMARWHFAALRTASRFMQDGLVVLDRHWLSEQIYSRVYRGGQTPHDATSRACHGWLKSVGAIYVLCVPAVSSAIARHAVTASTRGEMYASGDVRIGHVAQMFLTAYNGEFESGEFPGNDLLADVVRRGGLHKVLGKKNCVRYDIDKHGENVVDFADTIVQTMMTQRQ